MNAFDRITVAAARLGVTRCVAERVAARDVEACEALVADLTATWADGTCCERTVGEWQMACEHLRRLWDARSYLELARCKAPITGAYPCSCNGSGIFWSNGPRGAAISGVCFRCAGKGWQTSADRKRNAYYDNHVRRIPA